MKVINRIVAIVKPRQPFVDWAKSLPDAGEVPDVTLADLRDDCMTFLVPDYEDNGKALEYILKNSREIFELELESWDLRVDLWPKNRDRRLFKKWFDVVIHSQVVDLGKNSLEHEEY
ncbi:hypothetical protein [Maridesulfovibrio sp.]|uniref:hypothetical protein n=1 Tax=Maridesulfovibrio sp. TaxID=2795000 RepID=UPI002A187A0E|nr:hypothetical protein [Maridesulfovibrio sp.]